MAMASGVMETRPTTGRRDTACEADLQSLQPLKLRART
jgi:hypothetical protein